jgi:hypothetical protein
MFSMKSAIVASLAAVALAASALAANAQDLQFELNNNSSLSLHYFYVSPSNEDSWGDDLLGPTGTLDAGYTGTVTIADGSDQCAYDFMFVMEDDTEKFEYEINICELASYTLTD